MRSAADFETPNNGATCRNVRFVRQYVATSKTRCSSVSRQGAAALNVTASTPDQRHQTGEPHLGQPGESH